MAGESTRAVSAKRKELNKQLDQVQKALDQFRAALGSDSAHDSVARWNKKIRSDNLENKYLLLEGHVEILMGFLSEAEL